MSILGRANVHNDSSELILVVLAIGFMLLFIHCVVVNIQLIRELPSRVYFLVLKFVIVEADSLEMDDKVVW